MVNSHWLELKIPPVAVFLVAVGAGYGLCKLFPSLDFNLPFRDVVLAICFGLSGFFGLNGIWMFRRVKTTVHPIDLEKVSSFVEQGAFKVTRNPMYLGLLLLLVFEFAWLENGAMFLAIIGFVVYMNRFQIVPEERFLERRFGSSYVEYRQRVRRWL